MKLIPLKQWICDKCGETIEKPEDGWLEWLQKPHEGPHGYKIVHHSKSRGSSCYHYEQHPERSDMHLNSFLGSDGMVPFISALDVGPYHSPKFNNPPLKDMRNFVETLRRLHLPYYEEARLYWRQAKEDGFFDGANEYSLYMQTTLKEIINKYGP
ncbi:MAG: hypothetical protein V3S46_00645 [Nitrospinota bacterium]